ncbi:helix-turn-helix transcriptional regulator [Arenivirga flava]|uniref:HTH-type transcriptional regulator RipA n=1 Tax=Arenivirga flava TaxID=1930060 RepID=A0AA37ULH5_9MICO|nr:AraC family transcriptional regulator [Arenivirga flava]GMA28692.1 AraC family transcriptional regulator [Arenivirga flava]
MHAEAAHGSWRREARTVLVSRPRTPVTVPAPFAISSGSIRSDRPLEFAPHAHRLHELVWVRGGTMTVRSGRSIVTVPEGSGLWLPAGTEHSGRITAAAVLCDAQFDPARSPVALADVTVVEIRPVLGALLTHLQRDDLQPPERLRAEAVVFDLIRPARRTFVLAVPDGGRISAMVEHLLDDPADPRSGADWARELGLSERSLTRAFRAQTGLSYLQWRQTLRVQSALTLLGEGAQVQEVAEQLGYAQPSTFIAAFRRITGTTPGAFTARPRHV